MNKKMIFILGVLALLLIGLYSAMAFSDSKNSITKSKKIQIITTLFPIYDFARQLGGDKVEVVLLLPPGVEAHAFEPTPSDMIKINQSDIFVYTGEFMEPWAHDIIKGLSNKNIEIVDASNAANFIGTEDEHNHETETGKEEIDHQIENEHEHEHGGLDPHIWLDFDNAKIMTENISKALIKKDSANANFYQNNTEIYKEKLSQLDNIYKEKLLNCKDRTIIYGGHYAFAYLAKKYNLNYMAAQGFAPDSEPTANDLITLVKQIRENNIDYIFYEELSSPKIAETLANETESKILLLNGAHNLTKADYDNNESYISLMETNLKNLSIGLKCEK